MAALFLLAGRYTRAEPGRGHAAGARGRARLSGAHATGINNWDLVDASAEFVVGPVVAGA